MYHVSQVRLLPYNMLMQYPYTDAIPPKRQIYLLWYLVLKALLISTDTILQKCVSAKLHIAHRYRQKLKAAVLQI